MNSFITSTTIKQAMLGDKEYNKQDQSETVTDANKLIPKAQMELAFFAACRNGKAKGLKGKTNRAEYIDMLVRLALAAFKPKKKEKLSGLANM